MPQKKIIIILIVIVIIALAGTLSYFSLIKKSSIVLVNNSTLTNQLETSIEYQNTQYGFSFSLPLSWQNYSIVNGNWEGTPVDNPTGQKVQGPEIFIRHPLWTAENPRQDIPIMIFTLAQWDLIQQEKIFLGAAPIGPSELGRNANYVFALPARYNFAFPAGFEEVDQIIAGKPLRAN